MTIGVKRSGHEGRASQVIKAVQVRPERPVGHESQRGYERAEGHEQKVKASS